MNLTEKRKVKYFGYKNLTSEQLSELNKNNKITLDFTITKCNTKSLNTTNTIYTIVMETEKDNVLYIDTSISFTDTDLGITFLMDFLDNTKLKNEIDLENFEMEHLTGKKLKVTYSKFKNKKYDATLTNSSEYYLKIDSLVKI